MHDTSNGSSSSEHIALLQSSAMPQSSTAPDMATSTSGRVSSSGGLASLWNGTGGGSSKRQAASLQPLQTSPALMAELSYCLASSGTILFNKHLLGTWMFPAPTALLCFQFGVAVVLLQALQGLRIIHLQPLHWELVKLWMPVNLIFVGMNVTGFYALRSVGAGMFTVLKNLSNLLTIIGDWYFFGNTYSLQVWACLALIIASAILGGFSDLGFSTVGYSWQVGNCAFTAAYSLMLGGVIRRVTAVPPERTTSSSSGGAGASGTEVDGARAAQPPPPMTELSMVFYNNVLSLPPLLLLMLCSNELPALRRFPEYAATEFQIVAVLGALLGFCVSFASIWCMNHTTPTLFSMTGSLNKVIVAIVGLTYFAEPTNPLNLASIVVGLLAGVLFVFAKAKKGRPLSESGAGGSSVVLSGVVEALRARSVAIDKRASSGADLRTIRDSSV